MMYLGQKITALVYYIMYLLHNMMYLEQKTMYFGQ